MILCTVCYTFILVPFIEIAFIVLLEITSLHFYYSCISLCDSGYIIIRMIVLGSVVLELGFFPCCKCCYNDYMCFSQENL